MHQEPDGVAAWAVGRRGIADQFALGKSAFDAAFRRSPPQVFPAGASLIEPSQPAIHRVRRGWACRLKEWPDGRRAIVEVYLQGDVIGGELALADGAADPVVAITSLTVDSIDLASALPELLAAPGAALHLGQLLLQQRRRVDRLAAALARLDAHRRIAVLLSDFAERLHRGGASTALGYHLPLTQQQIGDHLGLTVVHVNRVLRWLREARIVEVNRHVVVIRDAERLERLASGALRRDGFDSLTHRRVDRQMPHRKSATLRQDLGNPPAMADLPVGLVAD